METRFNALELSQKLSVKKYYINSISPHLDSSQKVLDLGCGSGGFLIALSPYCGSITGTEISDGFINQAAESIKSVGITNATLIHTPDGKLPFQDEEFDVLLLNDVIHHLEDISSTLNEALRVIKKGGRVIVMEPNKLNPLLLLLHALDPNERGLLKVGTPWAYRKILRPNCDINHIEFSSLVIGPESKVYDFLAGFMSMGIGKILFGWMRPKIFVFARKR